ncbi:MAG: DUF4260 domain-containing protein [Sphingobacteriales bacterium]|nr:DUF4260 domain-containing protein [Sphingobacteriales bacterium]
MKTTLKIEEAAMTIVAIYFISQHNLGLPLWGWFFLFFTPDIGMLGYLINTKVGAITYNLFHHKGIALGITSLGFYMQNEIVIAIGCLLFAHSAFDRIMDYGLKYPDSFKNTHLGSLEKAKA